MPLTPEEEKALVEKITTQLSSSITGIITPLIEPIASKVTGFEKNLSGQIARIAGETVKGLIPAKADDKGGDDPTKSKREEIETIKAQNKALADQHDDLVKRLAHKDDETEVRAALSKKSWIDSEEPVPVLLGQVKRNGKGKLIVPGKKMVGNVEMEDIELSLEQGVEQLATQKPHWLKSSLRGGTGASGGTSSSANVSADDAEKMSFGELRKSTSVPQMILDGKMDLLTQKAKAELAKGPQIAPARGRIPARLAQAVRKADGA